MHLVLMAPVPGHCLHEVYQGVGISSFHLLWFDQLIEVMSLVK